MRSTSYRCVCIDNPAYEKQPFKNKAARRVHTIAHFIPCLLLTYVRLKVQEREVHSYSYRPDNGSETGTRYALIDS